MKNPLNDFDLYSSTTRIWRLANKYLYISVYIWLTFYAFYLSAFQYNWQIADWLINYQGGFVRRGFLGEILFQLSTITKTRIDITVILLQLLLYAIFLLNTYELSLRNTFSHLNLMLIASPAFILFPVQNPIGGFRKEILLFAFLSLVCNKLQHSKILNSRYLPIFTGLLSIIFILSHEMLVICLPYVVCAYIINDNGLSVRTRKTILYMIPTALVIIILFFYKGNEQVVSSICNSLGEAAPLDCHFPSKPQGAITFLGSDLSSGYYGVQEVNKNGTLITYGISAILGFLPIFLKLHSMRYLKNQLSKSARLWMIIFITSSLVGSIPLFWIATDYGRIIYLHIVCLSLLLLMIPNDKRPSTMQFKYDIKTYLSWCLSLVYVSSWRLIHWGSTPDRAFSLYKTISRFFIIH